MRPAHCIAALLATLLAASGVRAAAPEASPVGAGVSSVLLVTFDTVRADRIGAYGDAAAETPTVDGLAARGVLYEAAVSATPITLPSHASILTGTYPTAHGVHDNGVFQLGRDATSLAEVFRERGARTAAFVGSYILDDRFGLDQGFETYRGPVLALEFKMREARRAASEVVDDAIAWLEQLEPGERFFVWVHFYDPHRPLREHDATGRRFPDPYAAAISACDRELGRLIRHLDERGMAENLLTVVTADHGESLGEHGESTHGIFVYQSSMRVPLIFSGGPLSGLSGVRVERAVTNAAIAPTLLRLAGLPRALMPAVRLAPLPPVGDGDPPAADVEPLLLQSLTPYYNYRWHALRGLIWRGHKLVRGSATELYALDEDPDELADLSRRRPEMVAEASRALDALVAEHAPLGWAVSHSASVDEVELLASLGYAVHHAGDDPFDPALPDPRKRIGDIALVDEAYANFERWGGLATRYATAWQRDQEGRKYLEKAHKLTLRLRRRNPRDPTVPYLLGAIESELRNYETAIPLLEQAARDRPFDSVCRVRLADAYAKLGRTDDAISELHEALDLVPEQPLYHQFLIGYALDARRFGDARRWMDRYAAAMPAGSREHRDALRWIAEQERRIPPDAARSPPNSAAAE